MIYNIYIKSLQPLQPLFFDILFRFLSLWITEDHCGFVVQYKLLYSHGHFHRNNGQPLMCDMAVIIQDQVSGSGVAGVAFSRHPNTGDPGKIIVAASYDLEKTVSLTSNH